MIVLSAHNPIVTVRSLICTDLHYCCPYAFFSLYSNVHQITLRLGVSRQAVHKWTRRMREGKLSCENSSNCLAARLSLRPVGTGDPGSGSPGS